MHKIRKRNKIPLSSKHNEFEMMFNFEQKSFWKEFHKRERQSSFQWSLFKTRKKKKISFRKFWFARVKNKFSSRTCFLVKGRSITEWTVKDYDSAESCKHIVVTGELNQNGQMDQHLLWAMTIMWSLSVSYLFVPITKLPVESTRADKALNLSKI